MLIVGLTGNIGSGKSTVAEIFRILNIPVFHTDSASKKHLANPEVITMIVREFGSTILKTDGQIDNAELATLAFRDAGSLRKLSRILHPLVVEDFRLWTLSRSEPYVIQEAAVIHESGLAGLFHVIIHVACPSEIAISRVNLRDKTDPEMIRQRMKHQFPEEKKAALSDFVIRNDGSILVIPQVLALHQKLQEYAVSGVPALKSPRLC